MKDDNGVVILAVAAAVASAAAVWWLSQKLGVSMEVTLNVLTRTFVVVVIYGLASWAVRSVELTNPWQFLPFGFWIASWPLLVAKGGGLPAFNSFSGFEPEYAWWASLGFRLLVMAVILAAAIWHYGRSNEWW